MGKEIEILNNFKNYLKELGYKQDNFRYEVRTYHNKIADFVVVDGDKNLIVAELKSNFFIEEDDFKFNPLARHTQKIAQELGAELYIITNGEDVVWLKTNEVGRPEKTDPVKVKHDVSYKEENEENFSYIKFLLDHVVEFLINHPITGDKSRDLSICLYNKLLIEVKHNILEEYYNDKVVNEIIERLGDISLIENKTTVLNYIDDFLRKNKSEWQVPRWLANFMVELYPQNKPKDMLLDIYAKFGTIDSSAYQNGWENVESFYFNKDYEYWIKTQQLLTKRKDVKAEFNSDLMTFGFGIYNDNYDCILVAPPFGYNITSNIDNSKKNSVEVLIRKAIDRSKINGWVISIIPDSILLSNKFKKFRNYLKNKHRLRAIINLPQETFNPFTSVRTSILVIQKKELIEENNLPTFLSTFYSKIEFNSTRSKFMNNWQNYLSGISFKDGRQGIVIEELNNDNFHFTNYWKNEERNTLNENFESIPLIECVEFIRRGNSFKTDKKEETAFIAPANIRSMEFIEENLSYTSIESLPNNYIEILEDDVLVNIIGTHRGSAVVAPSSIEGLGVNKHVVLIRPIQQIVLPYYLALALNSNYVKEQFEKNNQGTVIPSLSLKNFESIYIPLPSLIEQHKICSKYKYRLKDIRKKELEINKEKANLNKILLNLGKEGGGDKK